jgi:hypothetical protein
MRSKCPAASAPGEEEDTTCWWFRGPCGFGDEPGWTVQRARRGRLRPQLEGRRAALCSVLDAVVQVSDTVLALEDPGAL